MQTHYYVKSKGGQYLRQVGSKPKYCLTDHRRYAKVFWDASHANTIISICKITGLEGLEARRALPSAKPKQ